MKNLCSRLLSLAALLVVCVGCNHSDSSSMPKSDVVTSEMKPTQPVTSPMTLDLLVGGPFVFVQKNDCLILWIPNVKGHSKPLGVGLGDVPRSFDQADYDFTKGIRPSLTSKILVPVQVASMLSLSMTKYNPSATPKKKPYLTVKLPIPREIVPWNADPITVTDPTGSVSATTPRLSTLTILRYDFQTGDSPEMSAQGQPAWEPRPIEVGTERVILLAVIPPKPLAGEDEHKHARAGFQEQTKLVGVKRNIDFPSVTYTRNEPLEKGVLADDLLTVLGVNTPPADGGVQVKPAVWRTVFGTMNDCKSPNVLLAR